MQPGDSVIRFDKLPDGSCISTEHYPFQGYTTFRFDLLRRDIVDEIGWRSMDAAVRGHDLIVRDCLRGELDPFSLRTMYEHDEELVS